MFTSMALASSFTMMLGGDLPRQLPRGPLSFNGRGGGSGGSGPAPYPAGAFLTSQTAAHAVGLSKSLPDEAVGNTAVVAQFTASKEAAKTSPPSDEPVKGLLVMTEKDTLHCTFPAHTPAPNSIEARLPRGFSASVGVRFSGAVKPAKLPVSTPPLLTRSPSAGEEPPKLVPRVSKAVSATLLALGDMKHAGDWQVTVNMEKSAAIDSKDAKTHKEPEASVRISVFDGTTAHGSAPKLLPLSVFAEKKGTATFAQVAVSAAYDQAANSVHAVVYVAGTRAAEITVPLKAAFAPATRLTFASGVDGDVRECAFWRFALTDVQCTRASLGGVKFVAARNKAVETSNASMTQYDFKPEKESTGTDKLLPFGCVRNAHVLFGVSL
jgi:hypothetical protein